MVDFEKLEVWKSGCRLATEVYQALADCRDYGLRDQMQRSAVSIPSNIAEGAERQSKKEFVKFLYIAKGSSAELRTQLYIAGKTGAVPLAVCNELTKHCKQVSSQLQRLISSLKEASDSTP